MRGRLAGNERSQPPNGWRRGLCKGYDRDLDAVQAVQEAGGVLASHRPKVEVQASKSRVPAPRSCRCTHDYQ